MFPGPCSGRKGSPLAGKAPVAGRGPTRSGGLHRTGSNGVILNVPVVPPRMLCQRVVAQPRIRQPDWPSIAASSSMSDSIIARPFRQNAGSLAFSPNGASSSE
jgi:hypothetical protein